MPGERSRPRARVTRLRGFLTRWRNTSFSVFDHSWTLVLWAASTPVFLAALGEETFGIWVLINAVIGLGGVMSLGFSEATVKYVAKYRALDDRRSVAIVIKTTLVFYALAGLFFGSAIALSAPWIAEQVFAVTGELAGPSIAALRLSGLALFITSFLKTFESVINGYERFDVSARVGVFIRSFIILSNVVLALEGFGLAMLLGVTVLGLTAQTLIYVLLLRRRFGISIRFDVGHDRAITREVLSFSLQSWLQISAGALSGIVDRFLVGALVGPAAAGVYSVCVQLSQQVSLLLYRGLAFMMPASSGQMERDADPAALVPGYRAGLCFALLLIGSVTVPLYALASELLTLWVGASFARSGSGALQLLVVYFAVSSGVLVPFFLLNGVGRPGWNTIANGLHGIVTVTAAAILLSKLGLIGAPVARLMALPAFAITLIALDRHVLRGRGRAETAIYWSGILVLLAAAIIAERSMSGASMSVAALVLKGAQLGVLGCMIAAAPVLILRRLGRRATSPADL